MFLKLIRHKTPWGQLQRGTLYTVHFQPNEKGGYTETLTPISDVYEIAANALLPLELIYPAGVRKIDGHLRLSFGAGNRRSLLHLIDPVARFAFFTNVRCALQQGEELRLEIASRNSLN